MEILWSITTDDINRVQCLGRPAKPFLRLLPNFGLVFNH